MMKRIMKPGVAAVALAASALLAAPASAEKVTYNAFGVEALDLRVGGDIVHRVDNRGRGRGHGHGPALNRFGQTPYEAQRLAEKAIYECSCQLELDAGYLGYRHAAFRHAPYVEQIGPYGFIVKADAVLHAGRRSTSQPYECVVRQGQIARASDLYPVSYGHGRYQRDGYSQGGLTISFGTRF